MFKIENVKLAHVAIFNGVPSLPKGARQPEANKQFYYVGFYLGDNDHLETAQIDWKPTHRRLEAPGKLQWTARYKSHFPPYIDYIFENGDSYKDLLLDFEIADARNIGRDLLFRGAIADINIEHVDGHGSVLRSLQVRYNTMKNPQAPIDQFR